MTNRDLYFRDPTTLELLNNGVSKVSEIGHDEGQIKTLRFELQNFVCDGEYARGTGADSQGLPRWPGTRGAEGGLGQRLLRQRQVPSRQGAALPLGGLPLRRRRHRPLAGDAADGNHRSAHGIEQSQQAAGWLARGRRHARRGLDGQRPPRVHPTGAARRRPAGESRAGQIHPLAALIRAGGQGRGGAQAAESPACPRSPQLEALHSPGRGALSVPSPNMPPPPTPRRPSGISSRTTIRQPSTMRSTS